MDWISKPAYPSIATSYPKEPKRPINSYQSTTSLVVDSFLCCPSPLDYFRNSYLRLPDYC
nr:MAG TPA: hypothetical protein [Caudoviricetes sp.]